MSHNKKLLKQLQSELRAKGVTVKVQHAMTTSSSYVTFDRGVLGSLRVGDHPGKSRYFYKYEIGSHIKNRHEFFGIIDGKSFVRIKFPLTDVDGLITEILLERSNKIAKYSKSRYEKYKNQPL